MSVKKRCIEFIATVARSKNEHETDMRMCIHIYRCKIAGISRNPKYGT